MTDTSDDDTAAFNNRITAMAAFVQARCDEDEAAAKAATKGPWTAGLRNGDGDQFGEVWRLPPASNEYEPDEATAAHIIRHDPARVPAEAAAKRSRVSALLTYARKAEQIRVHHGRYGDGNRGEILGMLMAYMHAVSADAEIWAAHPDYEPNWRVGP